MTDELSPNLERSFVRDRLPWVIGVVALVIYLLSLQHWVTLSSLGQVARVNGWDWPPTLMQPLLFLVTYPFHWLPEGWVPVALNGFTAVCGSLTLVLLARSVALLPHDRLEQQRSLVGNENALLTIPDAWVPMALACAALGLQLTFWEHAIAASGEMLDLLVVAYAIRCLLEHRIDQRDAWLNRAALTFGVAMANNWAMVGFLPLFVVALLRTKAFRFFNLRFLRSLEQLRWDIIGPRLRQDLHFGLRMALLGLAGASLFFLLPLTQSFSPDSPLSVGQGLHAMAVSYKSNLHLTARLFFKYQRDIGLLLAASSLLPVLLLSIRWGSFGGAGNQDRFDLASFILHIAHAFLLVICLGALLDAPFSPRAFGGRAGMGMPFLPLYYLAALSVGYYSGYFLLLFGSAALQRLSRRHKIGRGLCLTVPKVVYVLAGLAVAGLLLKNVPVIGAVRAPHVERYARLLADSLPPQGAVVLSEDAIRLGLLQAALAAEGKEQRYLPVVTRTLGLAKYRAWLKRSHPGRCPPFDDAAMPTTPGTNALMDTVGVIRLLSSLAQSNTVYSLPAKPGLLLERFYLQPHGLVSEMKFYPTNALNAPPLSSAEVAENQDFWRRAAEQDIQPLSALAYQPELPRPQFERTLMRAAHLSTPPPVYLKLLAFWYSTALNGWGVTLQRNDLWKEATPWLDQAVELNPSNFVARVNLLCNSNHLEGHQLTLLGDPPFREQFAKYRGNFQALADNGPLDDPSYCYLLGLGYARAGMARQAAQQIDRAKTLAPRDLLPRLTLGGVYLRVRMPDKALQIVEDIRRDPQFQPLNPTNAVELAFLEADAWYAKTNRAKADATIEALLAAYADNPMVWNMAGVAFAAHQSYSNALRIVDQQLQDYPDNVTALVNQSTLFTMMGDFTNAIPPLTHALSLTNSYRARLNRAFVYFRAGQLEAAEADCRELLRAFPAAYGTYRMLGDIAMQKRDTNAAVQHYRDYVAKARTETPDTRAVTQWLKSQHQSP